MSETRVHRGPGKTMRHHVFKPGDVAADMFRIEHVIAAGGMAEVYYAIDIRTGEPRALKTLNHRYADNPNILNRLIREFDALKKATRPNLVRVYERGVSQDRFFYVMEYLDGYTLRELMAGRRLPLGVALSLTSQLAVGLHVLHTMGIVHRDVKPDNVIVLEAAGEPEHQAKLIDLGIAKQAQVDTSSGSPTLGTVTYMAPEQTRGDRVDARADVYAVCLILYEALARVHAMEGDSTPKGHQEWVERQREREPVPLTALGLGIDPIVSNIVQRGLAKRPDQRFDNAADLVAQLEEAMHVLDQRGELGDKRLHPFGPQRPQRLSGPQPLAQVRPPNVSEPTAGLPYRRTDEPDRPVPPVKISPEPPRVVAHDNQKTIRGTTKMLGRRGTVPHLGSPGAANPSPPFPAAPVTPPAPVAPPPPPPPKTVVAPLAAAPLPQPAPERAPEIPAPSEPPSRPQPPAGVAPSQLARKPEGRSDAPSGPGWKVVVPDRPLRALESEAALDDPTLPDKVNPHDLARRSAPKRNATGARTPASQALPRALAVALGFVLSLLLAAIVLLMKRPAPGRADEPAATPTPAPQQASAAPTAPEEPPPPTSASQAPAPPTVSVTAPRASASPRSPAPRPPAPRPSAAAPTAPPRPTPTPSTARPTDRFPDPTPPPSSVTPIFDAEKI